MRNLDICSCVPFGSPFNVGVLSAAALACLDATPHPVGDQTQVKKKLGTGRPQEGLCRTSLDLLFPAQTLKFCLLHHPRFLQKASSIGPTSHMVIIHLLVFDPSVPEP